MPAGIDYYQVLGVAPDAPQAELRKRYLTLARGNHPDRFDGADRQARVQAEARMQLINEAWNVVGVPHKRSEYDAHRATTEWSGRVAGGAHSGASGPFRGNAKFRPFDDEFHMPRPDIDLDPTPIPGSRAVSRWIGLMPVLLVVWGVLLVGFGLLMRTAAILALAGIVLLIGAAAFVLMPLLVMSRAERDPDL